MIHHAPKDEDEPDIFVPGEKDIEEAEKREREEWEREFAKVKDVFKGMPDEEKKKHADAFEEALRKVAMKWPDNLLTPPECDLISESWGYLMNQGYGDMREGLNSQVYREAIKEMDLDNCRDILGETVEVTKIPDALVTCLASTIEGLVHQKLIDDGHDQDKVYESNLYFNSPLDWSWVSDDEKIAEAGRKILNEE